MTIYYVKQDDTIWGCGDPECCGEYFEEITESFLKCEHEIIDSEMADHLHGCNGGGPVLKWRKAKDKEVSAYNCGFTDGYDEGWTDGIEWQEKKDANKRKAKVDSTVHELVKAGYTIIIEGNGAKEIHYGEQV